MKKLVLLLVSVFTFQVAMADNDKPVAFEQLPAAAQQFVKQNFPNVKVAFAKMENKLFGASYDVVFINGDNLEFDKNGQWTIAKGFDTFMPLGPYISDEVDPSKLDIECRVNGKTVQKSNTSNLIFPAKWLVSWLSQRMTLQEGDVILTGTPSGVTHVKPGDVIEVEIEGLGVLQNTVDVEE